MFPLYKNDFLHTNSKTVLSLSPPKHIPSHFYTHTHIYAEGVTILSTY